MIGFLRNLVFRDFWLKLFSVALAILIWKIVSPNVSIQSPPRDLTGTPSERTQTYFNVPLGVVSSAADVRDFKVSPNSIDITLKGEPDKLDKLRAQDIRAQVDLTGIEAASDLRKRIEVIAPPGVTVVQYNPEQANIIVPPKQ